MRPVFDPSLTAVVLIDVQEKFLPVISGAAAMTAKQKVMLKACAELGLRTIIFEQYPKGLGPTIPELKELVKPEWPVMEKTSFSCFGSAGFRSETARTACKTLILMGIETHVCVQQTALDAMAAGYSAVVPADAVSSRSEFDRDTSLSLMRHSGVWVTTVESILFALMKDSSHPAFRAVSKIIK
jgi:nicotinamidase-related amidase